MTLIYKAAEVVISTETGVNLIKICSRIVVVRVIYIIILKDRSSPQSSNTQFLKVIKMIDNTLNIATLTFMKIIEFYTLSKPLDTIIIRVTISKSIGHNEVKNIGFIETFSITGTRFSLFQFIIDMINSGSISQIYLENTGFSISDIYIQEQIIRVISSLYATDFDIIFRIYRWHISAYIFAMEHNLQGTVIHLRPPKFRLYPIANRFHDFRSRHCKNKSRHYSQNN